MCGNELMATLVVVSHPVCSPPAPTFVENHNLTLKCVIVSRGGPKPEVYWRHTKRNGVKVPRRRGHGGVRNRSEDAEDAEDEDGDNADANGEDGIIAANLGELWFAGNTSYNTFSFQVRKRGRKCVEADEWRRAQVND